MPAIYEEVEEALVEGVKIDYLTAPVEVRPRGAKGLRVKCIRMKLGKPDESGRRRPVPIKGSEYSINLDALVKAIGEQTDRSTIPEKIQDKWGNIEIDDWARTNSRKIFGGGDAATMEGTVVHAIASGKRAAIAIDGRLRRKRLSGAPKKVFFEPGEIDPYVVRVDDLNMDYFRFAPQVEQKQIPVAQRVKSTREVNLGLTHDEARAEAERCFSCGTCNMCDNCYIYCPDISIKRKSRGYGYIINYDYCKGCGVCNEECPRDAISMREEIG
jgi:2-oxoacid:acceptor oxidoreductase delta subunit (pyruvate/2-ketoisovalerate family)